MSQSTNIFTSCPKEPLRSDNFFAARDRDSYLRKIKEILPERPTCVEIGVFRGDFSEKILRIIKPRALYLVDPWAVGSDMNAPSATYRSSDSRLAKGKSTAYSKSKDLEIVKKRFLKEINDHIVNVNRQFSYDAKDDFEDAFFDFIYIDATHTYESVLSDLNDYFPKLKASGVIAGHDWSSNFPGVKKAVKEFVKDNNLKFLTSGRINVTRPGKKSKASKSVFLSSTDWALVRE